MHHIGILEGLDKFQRRLKKHTRVGRVGFRSCQKMISVLLVVCETVLRVFGDAVEPMVSPADEINFNMGSLLS